MAIIGRSARIQRIWPTCILIIGGIEMPASSNSLLVCSRHTSHTVGIAAGGTSLAGIGAGRAPVGRCSGVGIVQCGAGRATTYPIIGSLILNPQIVINSSTARIVRCHTPATKILIVVHSTSIITARVTYPCEVITCRTVILESLLDESYC